MARPRRVGAATAAWLRRECASRWGADGAVARNGEKEDVEVWLGVGADAIPGRDVDEVCVELASGLGQPPTGTGWRPTDAGKRLDITKEPCRRRRVETPAARPAEVSSPEASYGSGIGRHPSDADLPLVGFCMQVVPTEVPGCAPSNSRRSGLGSWLLIKVKPWPGAVVYRV